VDIKQHKSCSNGTMFCAGQDKYWE